MKINPKTIEYPKSKLIHSKKGKNITTDKQ